MKIEHDGWAIRRLGGYRYEVIVNHAVVGVVSVARCTNRSQCYRGFLASGAAIPGVFSSVKKAAAALVEWL